MKDTLKYKDFVGSVHYSDEDEVFFGKIEGINDLITFEGKTVADIKKAFIESTSWTFHFDFNAKDLTSGIYFYKLQMGSSFSEIKKMLLLR